MHSFETSLSSGNTMTIDIIEWEKGEQSTPSRLDASNIPVVASDKPSACFGLEVIEHPSQRIRAAEKGFGGWWGRGRI